MLEQSLDILEFIEHPAVLNDRSLSEPQRTILKSVYGEPLNEREHEIHRIGTGREQYDQREQTEVTVIAGRRSGKTGKIAAPIAVFEAFRAHDVPPGEQAYVLLLAPQLSQARIAFRFILKYIQSSPILSKRVRRVTKNEITFDNRIIISCHPCSYVAVRGITIVAVICDEMAFWCHKETAANPEHEILEALRPGMATVRRPKLIKISTPFRKEGILFSEFQRRTELDFPVWQVPTSEMNPAISTKILDRARVRDEQTFRREFMAEFCEDVISWIDPETLEACVIRNRRELPRLAGGTYLAVIDPGFRHSDFALAILQRRSDGKIVLCRIVRWRGTKKAPLGLEWVCRQIQQQLGEFSLNRVIGDQFCVEAINQELGKLGIVYEEICFGTHTRGLIFGNLRHLLNQRKIELLDSPELLSELRSLDELKTDRGQIDIRPGGGMRDDLAVVVALGANELSKETLTTIGPILGISNRSPSLGLIPDRCPVAAICANYPRCLDLGSCQDFIDERLSA